MSHQTTVCSRAFLLLTLLLLAACGSPPPPASSGGYTLEVRGGTTNIDRSFFNPSSLSAQQQTRKLEAVNQTLRTRFGVEVQETVGIGVNYFAQLLKDGKALTSDTPLKLFGVRESSSKATLKAGEAWTVLYPLIAASGPGEFRLEAEVGGNRLGGSFNISPQDPYGVNQLLPIPQELSVRATDKVVSASWKPVTGAQSYLLLLYNPQTERVVWAAASRSPQVLYDRLELTPQVQYEADLLALSWDASLSTQNPYTQPLPARFDASVVSTRFGVGFPTLHEPQANLTFSATLGSSVSGEIRFRNIGFGPLVYQVQIVGPDASAFEVVSGSSGVAEDGFGREPTRVEVRGRCPNTSRDLSARAVLTTNASNPSVLEFPINLECYNSTPPQARRIAFEAGLGRIHAVAWSPDRRSVAAIGEAANNQKLALWNPVTGQGQQTIRLESGFGVRATPFGLAWSPDSQQVLVALGDRVRSYDAQTGAARIGVTGLLDARYAAWNPSGTRFAVASLTQIWVFNSTGQQQRIITYSGDGSSGDYNLLWNQNNQLLIQTRNGIEVFDTDTGTRLRIMPFEGGVGPGPIALTPDRSIVVGNLSALRLGVWEVSTGNLLRSFGIPDGFNDVKISPDGQQIALSYQSSRSLEIKSLSDGTTVRTLTPLEGYPGYLSWNPAGGQVAASDGSGLVRLWNTGTGITERTLGQPDELNDLLLSSNGWLIGSGRFRERSVNGRPSGAITVLDPTQGIRQRLIISSGVPISAQRVESTGNIAGIVSVSDQWILRIWDSSGNVVSSRSLTFPANVSTWGRRWSWSRDGSRLAYGSQGDPGSWRLHDLASNSTVELAGGYNEAAWKPDGTQVAFGGETIDVLDGRNGQRLRRVGTGLSGLVWANNNWLISNNFNLTAYDAESGDTVVSRPNWISSLAINPSGRSVVSFDPDDRSGNTLLLSSIASGRAQLRFQRRSPPESSLEYVTRTVWSADGQRLAFGTNEGGLEVWEITQP